ncbi:MAG TPA: manganese catalase family protein [Bryobacteraceae bacterium]|nr:manganese catalase family protein [Bryobacteraceae bacterium]HPQ16343.1 manganese catalase family protein [Bryobacteraceae bacterium]HPU73484.1 manganese catalase family protein [Bryobacteraceae bacterium]
MFHHVKELQFNARVSNPDPRFARLLLEQFGGANGELKAAMQYFTQAFGCRQAYPETYDLLMDIGTEEFSHLEVVGATIQMLLSGVNGELKNAVERTDLGKILNGGKGAREDYMHEALTNPEFLVLSGGTPTVTNAAGVPWSGTYVEANGELTVDLRSNIAAESRAKIVYEYLMQFTDDPLVKESLGFLMTREIAHMQMFTAALDSIAANFPPGVLQGDPRYTHLYFNMSDGVDVRGRWNQGQGPWNKGEEWVYVSNPHEHVQRTQGLVEQAVEDSSHNLKEISDLDRRMSQARYEEVKKAVPTGRAQWSDYKERARKQG